MGVVCLSTGWRRRRALKLTAGCEQRRVQGGNAAGSDGRFSVWWPAVGPCEVQGLVL